MSQDSLLLCGHACNSQYDQIKKAGTNTVLGTVSVRVYPALNGTTSGDYSIVTVSGSHNLQGSVWNGWDSEGIRQIYGYNTYLYNNLDVISCGMTSDWKSGQIKDTNATSIYYISGGSITITGMIKVLPNGSGSETGDSGGPYFLEINNQLYFIGIHSGRIGAYQYFTPYSIIQNATGFYPYTYGN